MKVYTVHDQIKYLETQSESILRDKDQIKEEFPEIIRP